MPRAWLKREVRCGPPRCQPRLIGRAPADNQLPATNIWRLIFGAAAVLGITNTLAAQPADEPPEFVPWRYDEDWSYLADPAERTGAWWEPLKYQELADDAYLSTGLEVRARYESISNNAWGIAAEPDDSYLLLGAIPHIDLHLGAHARFFGQLIVTEARGVEPSPGPADDTGIDIAQAFAEVRLPLNQRSTLVVRGGRRLLSYGSERLLGTRYGANVPLPFDGGGVSIEAERWRVDGFYGRPVKVGADNFDDATSNSRELWGVYGTLQRPLRLPGALDLYYLGYSNEAAAFNQGAGPERRHTVGARVFGTSGSWDWNWEAMHQFGSFAGGDISAWSVATDTGYRIEGAPLRPQLRLRANVASGDKGLDDADLQTFNAMFPKAKYFGELTPVGPYNLVNLHPSVDLDLGNDFTLGLAATWFWRHSRDDGVYDLPGNLIRASQGSRARSVGTQQEAVVGWRVSRNLELLLSYSRFEAGRFIRETGAGDTIHLAAVEATYRF